jgi:hypothetical protein
MTDVKEESVPNKEELFFSLEGRSLDWYLQWLVSTVNTSSMEFGVTLFVEGAIISGVLVSGKKYFETFAKEFSGAYPGDDDSKEVIRKAFAGYAEIYAHENTEDERLRPTSPPQYIHLVDVKCFSPGGGSLPSNRGLLWRGKINAVSGFSLGTISADRQ